MERREQRVAIREVLNKKKEMRCKNERDEEEIRRIF